MKNTTQLNKMVKSILNSDKKIKENIQKFIIDFLESFCSPEGLNKNSTPLNTLLKGLKQKDVMLIAKYVKTISNAHIALNKDNNFVLKIKDAIIFNDNVSTLKWYDTIKTEKTEENENKFKSLDNAFKSIDKLFEKALNTCESEKDKELLKGKLNNLITML